MNNDIVKSALLLLLTIAFVSCKTMSFRRQKIPHFYDFKTFPYRKIEHDAQTKFMFISSTKSKTPKSFASSENFETYLKRNRTLAFLVIKNDTIKYEKYFKGSDQTSIVNSFSIAKSVLSLLIGCALDDYLISSIEAPITIYLLELMGKGFDRVTIRHLLQMTSGIKFDENYTDRKKDALQLYYGKDTRTFLRKLQMKNEPGSQFDYISINSQLLGLILERVLKTKTVSQYLQERIWKPLGMEDDATWSVDNKENGLEKTYCCISARPVDFAKIGRLYLNKGNWNGVQVVSESWVTKSTSIDTTQGSAWNYQHNWWLPTKGGDFMAEGHLGQFIYVDPTNNLIVVRFGVKEGEVKWWLQFLALAAEY